MTKQKRKYSSGKSKCCKAEVGFEGGGYGGYDGTEIMPVFSYCKECGKKEPAIIGKVGRPAKVPF